MCGCSGTRLPGWTGVAPVDGAVGAERAAETPERSHSVVAPPRLPSLDRLLDGPELEGSTVALVVERPNGHRLHDRNGAIRLMPASNMKIVVSGCALDLLGEEAVFTTTVATAAQVVDGVVEGDLYLVGGGDPSLRVDDLAELAADLRSQGIVRVAGDLAADQSVFDDDHYGVNWSTGYLERWYAAPISGLSLNRNIVRFRFHPGAPGEPAEFTTDPEGPYLEIDNRSETTEEARDEPTLYLDRELWSPRVTLTGRIRPGAEEHRDSVTVIDPADFAITYFERALRAAGIEVAGGVRKATAPDQAVVLAENLSAPLRDLVRRLNKYSDNHYAEQIFRTLGTRLGEGGSRRASESVVDAWLEDRVGVPSGDVAMADGSGLSRYDLVTARTIAAILRTMEREHPGGAFRVSLPIAAKDGTLTRRMRSTPAAERVLAKTGYIGRVRALSGYVMTEEGEVGLVFSMIMNNYRMSTSRINSIQDRVCNALVTLLDGSPTGEAPVPR
jgi:D-alanyl-D-alanine carboxypeptidase/D-alanyl-D-alanine-endopeptidase (penicillin-binding protein 4)